MTFPLWAAGQWLTADEMNNRTPVEAVSLIGQTISTTTLTNVDELFIPVRANVIYKMTARINYLSATTTDAKVFWTIPTGASLSVSLWALTSGVGDLFGDLFTHAQTIGPGSPGAAEVIGGAGSGQTASTWMAGLLQMGDTAGNLQFQAAANAAGTLTIGLGSTIGVQAVKM